MLDPNSVLCLSVELKKKKKNIAVDKKMYAEDVPGAVIKPCPLSLDTPLAVKRKWDRTETRPTSERTNIRVYLRAADSNRQNNTGMQFRGAQ